MRSPPSLSEVIDSECDYEWLSVNFSGLFLGDFADSENTVGQISSPAFYLLAEASESEFGTFSYEKAVIFLNCESEEKLQNLEGESPLGNINYYDQSRVGINVNISHAIFEKLFHLVSCNIDGLSLRIAVPIWSDSNIKFLPLMKYQISYSK